MPTILLRDIGPAIALGGFAYLRVLLLKHRANVCVCRDAGFNSWHFNNRSTAQHSLPYDMRLGAVAMPTVVAKLREIGSFIVNNTL